MYFLVVHNVAFYLSGGFLPLTSAVEVIESVQSVCLCVCLCVCVCVCNSALSWLNRLTYGRHFEQKDFKIPNAGGAWTLRRFHSCMLSATN